MSTSVNIRPPSTLQLPAAISKIVPGVYDFEVMFKFTNKTSELNRGLSISTYTNVCVIDTGFSDKVVILGGEEV